MLKKLSSVVLAFIMLISIGGAAFAEYFVVDGYKENNLSAQEIVLHDKYAFVVSGKVQGARDVLNVYDLGTKELVTTLALPVYKTGKDYFIEGIYKVGDYMHISWNRHGGSGDPMIRKYEINKMLSGTLEHVDGFGVRDDKVTYLYENKLFFTDPHTVNLNIYYTDKDNRQGIMALPTKEYVKEIKGICADSEYFYLYKDNEIIAYSMENVNAGLNHNLENKAATYESDVTIKDVISFNGNIVVTSDKGMEILKVSEGAFEPMAEYILGGEIMAVSPQGSELYVYAAGKKRIQVLDASNLSNITVKSEIAVKNSETAGVKDIEVANGRIYTADLTDGFVVYSQNELDKLEQQETKAETYAQELEISPDGKAIELVVGLGIMNLRSNGLFGTELYITRGEFSQSVAKLLGDSINGTYAANKFTDVPLDSEYSEGIYGLANLGYLNGFGDGTFRPDDPISYEHAVRIMLRVLGYYPLVESGQREPLDLAAELRILESVTPMQTGFISRENAARLIYNSLETETLKFSQGLDPFFYQTSQVETLLYKMGIEKVKGQLTATELTSITGTYTAAKDRVEISGKEYYEGKSGASAYLGRYVTAYYKVDDDIAGEIVYIIKDKREEVITVYAEDISPETSQTVFAYYDEDYKLKKEDIQNASIIINGKFYADYKAADLIPADGEVILTDADGDGEIDIVIVDSYETYVVNAYGSGIFKFKYGYSDINLKNLPNDAEFYVTVDGFKCDSIEEIANVKEWSIVSVKKSHDGKIFDIYVTNNKITGIITETQGDKSVKLDNVEYKLSKSYLNNTANPVNNLSRALAGDEVQAYFDVFGKIAATKEIVSSAVYGYMVGCTRGKGLDTDKASFKILARDNNNLYGSMQYFESAENFKINGKKVEDIHTVTELFDPQTGLKRQLIKFVLNGEGKIRSIETALNRAQSTLPNGDQNPNYDAYYAGYDENSFSFDAVIGKSQAYRVGNMGTFEGEPFLPDSMTQIFVIPTIEDDAKDDDYKIYGYTTIFKSGGTHQAPLHLYDVTENYKINAIVIKATAADIDAVTSSGSYALVDSFVQGLTEDGERKWMLRSAKDANGEYTDIPIADEEIADTLGVYNASYKDKKLLELPKGSIVQYIKDGYGEIANIAIMFIPDSDNKVYFEYGNTKPSATSMPVKFYSAFGKIFKVTDGRIIFNAHGEIDDNADKVVDRIWDGDINTAQRNWDRNLKIAGTKYLYDSNTGKISTITTEDILPGDDMYIIKSSVYVKFIVIYR